MYKYLTTEKICPKQFGFQTGHSTERAIVKLAIQIYESFRRNQHTLGIFVDLSKVFDNVNYSVLSKKVYGIRDINLAGFCSYPANRKEYILLGPDLKAVTQSILCGVPQGSIPGLPLFFVIC